MAELHEYFSLTALRRRLRATTVFDYALQALRTDLAALEKALRADMVALETVLLTDMASLKATVATAGWSLGILIAIAAILPQVSALVGQLGRRVGERAAPGLFSQAGPSGSARINCAEDGDGAASPVACTRRTSAR